MTPEESEDATKLGKRTPASADDQTRLSTRTGDDQTHLSSRAQESDATRLSTREQDAMRPGKRPTTELYEMTGLAQPSGWAASPLTETGVEEISAVYDPGTDGIVLTSYAPREHPSIPERPEVPVPQVVFMGTDQLEQRAEIRRVYQRGTRIRLAALAGAGAVGFAASVAGAIFLAQGL